MPEKINTTNIDKYLFSNTDQEKKTKGNKNHQYQDPTDIKKLYRVQLYANKF